MRMLSQSGVGRSGVRDSSCASAAGARMANARRASSLLMMFDFRLRMVSLLRFMNRFKAWRSRAGGGMNDESAAVSNLPCFSFGRRGLPPGRNVFEVCRGRSPCAADAEGQDHRHALPVAPVLVAVRPHEG